MYYPVDSHPNGAASAIIADGVVGALMRQGAVRAICAAPTGAGA